MSQAGNCTPSTKGEEAFLKCNPKKKGGLISSQAAGEELMSHAETRRLKFHDAADCTFETCAN